MPLQHKPKRVLGAAGRAHCIATAAARGCLERPGLLHGLTQRLGPAGLHRLVLHRVAHCRLERQEAVPNTARLGCGQVIGCQRALKEATRVVVVVQAVRQELGVREHVARRGKVRTQPKLEDIARHLGIFAHAVLHQRACHKDVVRHTGVLARCKKDLARRLSALGAPSKTHQRDVRQRAPLATQQGIGLRYKRIVHCARGGHLPAALLVVR
mmetsp:Transcript_2745/g.8245  ORF Transcript_2745/g.8245 Transcript_2745/m.8245 type:complete len:212 (-) Transcript_2745:31-666(-)